MATGMAPQDRIPSFAFAHRQNDDGTVDAICLNCFLTAATSTTLEELSKKELDHGNNCFNKKCPASISYVREGFRKDK
jgi:hypothetical protein